MQQVVVFPFVNGAVNIVYNGLSNAGSYLYSCLPSFTSMLKFKINQNPKCLFAVKEEIKYQVSKQKVKYIIDGNSIPQFDVANGYHKLLFDNEGIYVDITDEEITIWNYSSITKLEDFMKCIYQKFIIKENMIFVYISEANKWSYPNIRRARKIDNLTPSMTSFLNDFNTFKSAEAIYENEGRPYRKGYFIEGVQGSGKSTMVEKIAMDNNMPIYNVCFTDEKMTDSMLISMITSVPTRSIIVFDEFEKQYNHPKRSVGESGLLSAIDGTQRLSHGTIVIMIVNDSSKIDSTLLTLLLRPGRIDSKFVFTEKF